MFGDDVILKRERERERRLKLQYLMSQTAVSESEGGKRASSQVSQVPFRESSVRRQATPPQPSRFIPPTQILGTGKGGEGGAGTTGNRPLA